MRTLRIGNDDAVADVDVVLQKFIVHLADKCLALADRRIYSKHNKLVPAEAVRKRFPRFIALQNTRDLL